MKIGKEEPLELIRFDSHSGKFTLNAEALQFVSDIKGPVGVISLAGIPRSGKSFLINRLLLNRKEGFTVNSQAKPQGQGVWIWGKPILGQTSKGETISVLVLDTQGMPFVGRESGDAFDVQVMCTLLSSMLIYNSIAEVEKSDIQTLWELVQGVEEVAGNVPHYCQSLCWILRDFPLEPKKSHLTTLSPLQYLEQVLNTTPNSPSCSLFSNTFSSIDCATLVRPLVDESSLEYLDLADYESLSPEFVDQLIQLRRKLLNKVVAKRVNNKIITGELWAEMVVGYFGELNLEKTVSFEKVWRHLCRHECDKNIELSLEMYLNKVREAVRKTLSEDSMRLVHKEAKHQSISFLEGKCKNNTELPLYIVKLKQCINNEYVEIATGVQRECLEKIRDSMAFEYQSVERKLKLKEIVALSDYKREIQLFTEFGKKKATNGSSREFVLEFINKKVIEAASYFLESHMAEAESKKQELLLATSKLQEDMKLLKKTSHQEKSQLKSKLEQTFGECKEYQSSLQSTEETLQSLKGTKDQLEREYWEVMLTQKSTYQKTINELKVKLSIAQNTLDESSRDKLILESQLSKKEMLSDKAAENSNNLLKEQKDAYEKLRREYKSLKASFEEQISQLDSKHSEKIKDYMTANEQMKTTIAEYETKTDQLDKVGKRLEDKNGVLEREKKEMIQELSLLKAQVEGEYRQLEKKISENKLKVEKVTTLEQEMGMISEENRRLQESNKLLSSQLDKERALNEQKVSFIEIQLQEYKQKSQNYEEKIDELLVNFNTQQVKLQEELNQLRNRELELKRIINLQEISIDEIRNKNQDLKAALEEKEEEIGTTVKTYKGKQQNLEHSKIVLESQLRQLESQNTKNNRLYENKAEEEINRLNNELQRTREAYEGEIDDVKMAFEQTLQQVRSLHDLEKNRLQTKLQQQKAKKDKRSQGLPEIQLYKTTRESNQRLQEEILEVKKRMWDEEKDYRVRINHLESKLNIKAGEVEELKSNLAQSPKGENLIEQRVMTFKINDLKKEIQDKDKEVKGLISEKSSLVESLRHKTEEMARLKAESNATMENLQDEIKTNKDQISLLKTRNTESANDHSLFKKSVMSKQESLLLQNKYLSSNVSPQHHSTPPKRTSFQKAKIQSKLLEALKEVSAIQEVYLRTKQQMNQIHTIHQHQTMKLIQEKSVLERKLQMLCEMEY